MIMVNFGVVAFARMLKSGDLSKRVDVAIVASSSRV